MVPSALVILVGFILDEALSDSGWIGFVKLWILTPLIIVLVAIAVARRFPSAPNSERASGRPSSAPDLPRYVPAGGTLQS